MAKKFELHIHDGFYDCGDRCCSEWYTNISVDGVHLDSRDDDLVEKVLSHVLGIEEGNYESHTLYLEALFAAVGFQTTVTYTDTVEEDMEMYD